MRIDDGALLDAAEQIDHARGQLSDTGRHQIAGMLGCESERLDKELDTLAARAKSRALKLRITAEVRDRARNGRYAFVHDRGRDFAAGIWVVDPAFMIDLVHEQIQDDETAPALEEAYFAGARLDDDELRDAAAADEQRRAQARARQAEATRSNLGLGHDIRAELMRPMLSPALVALNHESFVIQDECETAVDLAGRHAASSLDDLDLDELKSAVG